jgi:hypothetical protein
MDNVNVATKVTIVKFLDDVKISESSLNAHSPQEMFSFMNKLEVKRPYDDVVFDFNLYEHKTYAVYDYSKPETEVH